MSTEPRHRDVTATSGFAEGLNTGRADRQDGRRPMIEYQGRAVWMAHSNDFHTGYRLGYALVDIKDGWLMVCADAKTVLRDSFTIDDAAHGLAVVAGIRRGSSDDDLRYSVTFEAFNQHGVNRSGPATDPLVYEHFPSFRSMIGAHGKLRSDLPAHVNERLQLFISESDGLEVAEVPAVGLDAPAWQEDLAHKRCPSQHGGCPAEGMNGA